MKTFHLLPLFLFFISCNYPNEKLKAYIDSINQANRAAIKNIDSLTCDDLNNKSIIYQEAIKAQLNGYPEIDTSNVLIVRDHFISKDSISTLIRVEGHGSTSCGSGCNLLMLFSCGKTTKMIWSGYIGELTRDSIRDLDNDGIVEIISHAGTAWQGECDSFYEIFNLAGGKQNMLYKNNGYSYVGCGFPDDNHKKGDTIGINVNCKLIDPDSDKVFEVRQCRQVRIYNGGTTEGEIIEKEIHKNETIDVPLEKLGE